LKKRLACLLLLGSLPGLCVAAEPPPVLLHVVDGHGRPVAGATVRAAADPETVLQEKTAADGIVRFSGLPDDRVIWVLAERRGLSPALESFSGGARRERRLVLAPGTLAVGRVVDEKGRPVVGAEAELTGEAFGLPSTSPLPGFLRERPKVRTGPAGRFRFRDLPAGRYELRLRHPAFAPLLADHPVQGGRNGDLGRLVLRRGEVLTGTVTDPDGRPVADLPLWTITEFPDAVEPLPPTAFTGEDGTFAIPGLPPGELALYTCGHGYHPETVTVHFLDEPVHLTVRPAAALHGRVLGPDGEPLAGASLAARPADRLSMDSFGTWTPCGAQDQAVSDADGRFVVGPLDAGWYDLLATASGMKRGILPMQRAAAGEPGEEVEIRLEAGGVLSGRVLDEAGVPIADADLSLDGPWTEQARSARDGSFSLDIAFEEPSPAVLSATKCGYEEAHRELEDLAGEVRIDLVMARGGGCAPIRGRVVGPDGAPIERALVAEFPSGGPAWTAADGTFELPGNEGRFQIVAEKPGFAKAHLYIYPEAGPLGDLEIRLERGAVVTGRLLGLNEEDRSQTAYVLLTPPGRQPLRATMTGGWTFRVEDVPSGSLKLRAQAGESSALRALVLEPGQAELSVDVEMPAVHTVSGQVLDDRAQPVAGAAITVTRAGEEELGAIASSSTRADGSFALRLPDGSFSLYAFEDGFLQMDTGLDVEVDGGVETGLEIRLEPATVLRGRLFGLAPGERPTLLLGGPGYLLGQVELDRYEVEGLRPGQWTIEASLDDPEGKRVLRRTVEIPQGITALEADLDFAEAQVEAEEPEEEP
jgi:protocatechuate 3,4-dioxygenase beta subunit